MITIEVEIAFINTKIPVSNRGPCLRLPFTEFSFSNVASLPYREEAPFFLVLRGGLRSDSYNSICILL